MLTTTTKNTVALALALDSGPAPASAPAIALALALTRRRAVHVRICATWGCIICCRSCSVVVPHPTHLHLGSAASEANKWLTRETKWLQERETREDERSRGPRAGTIWN